MRLVKSKNFLLLLIGFLFFFFLFYWYQLRPSSIRSECVVSAQQSASDKLKDSTDENYRKAGEEGKFLPVDYKFYYDLCLNKKGLK